MTAPRGKVGGQSAGDVTRARSVVGRGVLPQTVTPSSRLRHRSACASVASVHHKLSSKLPSE